MKKHNLTYWHKKVWPLVSKKIRARDCLRTTGTPDYGLCITCGNRHSLKELQAGHFISSRYSSTKYDERNIHAQCYACNIYRKGNTAKYFIAMEQLYGRVVVDELLALSKIERHYKPFELEELYERLKG